jgi:hypothetical protein
MKEKKYCPLCTRFFDSEELYLKHKCIKDGVKEAEKLGMIGKQAEIWSINSIAKKLKSGKK